MKANGYFVTRRHLLFFCAAIALVGLIAASDALHSRTEEILAACEAIIADFPRLGMLLFVLLAMASAMLACAATTFSAVAIESRSHVMTELGAR